MEISPIAGIRNLPVARTPPVDTELAGVFDIENFARIGDETYTPGGSKSAGGSEDEFDEPDKDEEEEGEKEEATEEDEAVPEGRPPERVFAAAPNPQISYFA